MATPKPITAELTLTTRAGRPTIWIEVVYDGVVPPTSLFADLRMIGYDPPTEMPPPSSAMDWTAPDARTGRPYSVRSHRIETTIEPPVGTGPKRSWTPAERSVFQVSLEGVLQRHGMQGLEIGITRAIPSGVAAEQPPNVQQIADAGPALFDDVAEPELDLDDNLDVVGFGMSTSIGVSGTAAPPAAAAAPADDSLAWHRVVIASRGAELSEVLRVLRGAGLSCRLTRVNEQHEMTFRGSVRTTVKSVNVVEAICDAGQHLVLSPALESAGLDIDQLRIATQPARPADLAAFLTPSPTTSADSARVVVPAAHPTFATIIAVYDPRRRVIIDDALDDAGVTRRAYGTTERQVTTRYRAAEHTVNALAVRLEAMVEPDAVGAVVALLIRLGGLDASDEHQLRVVPALDNSTDEAEAPPEPGARLRLVG